MIFCDKEIIYQLVTYRISFACMYVLEIKRQGIRIYPQRKICPIISITPIYQRWILFFPSISVWSGDCSGKRSLLSFDNSRGWKCTTCKIQDWCWKFLICWCRELHNTNTSPCSPSTVSWKQTSVDLWHLMSNSFEESRDRAECVPWAILIHYFLRRQILNERDVLHYNSWKFPKTLDFLNPIAPHWASWLDPHHSHLSASPASIREEKPKDQLCMQSDFYMLVPHTFASGKLKGCGNQNLYFSQSLIIISIVLLWSFHLLLSMWLLLYTWND